MGNSESQFSSPGSKGTSCIFPGKPKPGSFRILSGKREVLSPHNWWRTSEAASSYKSRASGRGCLPHHRISQPYISTGGRASHHEPPRPGAVRQASQGRCFRGEGQDHALNVCGTPGRAALWEPTEDRCSPTVLLRGDASLRVEFSNVGSVGVGLALGGGVLQCPATGSCTSEPAPRARKGSSLSSDGSWYDCPWGLGGENSEADNTCSSGRTEYCSASDNIGFPVHSEHRSAGGDNTWSSCHTADCSTGDGTPSLGNTADCSTGDGTPSLGNTADCSTGDGTPSLGNTADCSTGDGTPSLGNTADCSTGDGTPSLGNTADCSTGDGTPSLGNTADCSTGDGTWSLSNTADCSTGDGTWSLSNTADCSTGDGTPSLGNTADCSTGDGTPSLGNTADCSTGDGTWSLGNTADCSTGDGTRSLGNTADCSTGDGTRSLGNTADCSTGDGTQPSGHTEDMTCLSGNTVTSVPGRALDWHLPTVSSLDPYGGPSVAATTPPYHHFSFGYIPDSAALEEQPGVRGYASCTLPCRRSPPVTDDNAQRSSLKSRMRRISDWTGSLRRKRRKLQEPQTEEAGRCLDEGGDTDSPSQTSAHPWPPTPFPALPVPCFGVSGTPPRPRHPSRDDDLDADAFRRSIYMSFMRELESGPAEDETGAGSSSRSLGSLEQLDLLLEDKERGTLRRAGPLSFKPLIALHRDRKLELVPRRRWRQYWVTLKGCLLLFHDTMGRSSLEQNLPPRHTLSVEDSMVQPVPEHPRKENVFCLSCACGDVYLFQASSQTDLENWVTAIHSAGASLLAKRHGKEDTVRLLRSQTRGLLQKIDMDSKMKKMAELQLSVISDQKNRRAIETQIHQWEQNLERFSMELFRLRCYLASLQGGELPNPKGLLAATSRPSKMALSRLGVFSVSSFHALVCSRDDAAFRKRSRSSRSRRGLLTSLKGLDTLSRRARDSPEASQWLDNSDHRDSIAPPEGSILNSSPGTNSCVCFPDNQAIQVSLKQDHCVADVLALACQLKGLDLRAHCLRLCKGAGRDAEFSTPASGDLVRDLRYDKMEVLPLDIFALHMSRPDSAVDFGFAVTGHVDELGHSRIFVCEVLPGGLAFAEGLKSGDEILALSGTGVSTLDLGLMQTVFDKPTLSLVLRREQGTIPEVLPRYPCPSTPSANQPQSLDNIMKLHNGALSSQDVFRVPDTPENGRPHPPMGNGTPPDMKSVETACTSSSAPKGGSGGLADSRADLRQPPCPRHPSAPRKLCKVVQELVDTEKNYVKDLGCLFEIYLKPLQSETFLSRDEMESLFGSLPEMLDFQRVFLQTLEDHIASSPDFSTMETPVQFKKLLISLGGSFLYYADHFKLYSGFCANHIKVQKVLERAKTDRAFKDFLEARNPTKQHSSTLESYLIKPVQRVLKYPLLLRELVSLTDTDSEEHDHLTGALKAMETVASHINEMQKIYEDYGAVFDQLVSEQRGTEKEVTEISMGEFLMHSSAVWLNPFPSLGRLRKAPELTLFVFMKAIILVYRESCKLKKKMTAARSTYSHAGLDPVKFRWLIPLSALQVRLGTAEGTQAKCIWELVHTKSELEGRPETRFQLGSRVLDPKANIVKVIHALLRDSTKRNVPAERGVLERLVSERGAGANTVTADRERVSSRASWLCRQWGLPDSDQGTLTRGTHPERGSPEHARNPPRHSGPLADEDELCGSVMETQFQRLRIAVETSSPVKQGPRVHPGATEMDVLEGQSNTVCAPYLPMRRKNSDQGDNSTVSLDLDSLLQREFSVQSLGSAVNEDFFYEKTDSADNTVPTS